MRRRAGLTIVEMLVATALIMFIMVILSEAFVKGLETFRQLKAVGDMNEKLRGTATLMRSELSAVRLEDANIGNIGKWAKLSKVTESSTWVPPTKGFFRVWQGSASTPEGTDPDGIPSYRATNNMLHFMMNLEDGGSESDKNRRDNFLSCLVPAGSPLLAQGATAYNVTGNTFATQYVEVAYFLRDAGQMPDGTQLYALYRQTFMVPRNTGTMNDRPGGVASTELANYADVSCKADPMTPGGSETVERIYFNGPGDLTVPQRRAFMNPTAGTAGLPVVPAQAANLYTPKTDGSDIQMTDVVSFNVQLYYLGSADAGDVPVVTAATNPNLAGIGVFDTWSSATTSTTNPYDYSAWATAGTAQSLPNHIQVTGVRVTLRAWDAKSQTTRQITIDQDL